MGTALTSASAAFLAAAEGTDALTRIFGETTG
jgi:hypothetical protein